MGNSITLLILLDAFRWDYLHPEDTPYLWSLKEEGTYVKKLHNPGIYCERSVFMTGAGPKVTGNAFAMSLMPIGYQRADWEPTFNVPMELRSRLCMTEDAMVDFEPGAFINPDEGGSIESFWDVMRDKKKKFGVEACVALGIRSYRGVTTHGTRPIQLLDKIKRGLDFAYIQYSETDQQMHVRGTSRSARKTVLRWVDGSVRNLVDNTNEIYKYVNVIVFGDHGMMDVKEHVDLALEYPPYTEGWDYLYLKSSAAVQFWVFNPKVKKHILNDPILKKHGEFIDSPSKRQGDLVWQCAPAKLISPCHFHPRWDAPVAMHGYSPDIDEMKGMAIIHPGKKQIIETGDLRDICPTVCDLVDIPYPKHNEGVSYVKR